MEENSSGSSAEGSILTETMNTENEDSVEISESGSRFRERLIQWTIKSNVPRSHITELLHILKEEIEAPYQINLNIPLDYRSLLKTPRQPGNAIFECATGGKMGFLGFSHGLEGLFQSGFKPEQSDLTLVSFVDGFSPYKSQKKKFYAILHSVKEDPQRRPFLSGIYIGPETPDFSEILQPLVNEFVRFSECPYKSNYLKKEFNISVGHFVCDLIAKAQIKGTKTTGYYSCDFCTERGVWTSHIYYPNFEFEERTDASFRDKAQPEHHKTISALESLPIDMVWDFPLDYMHQVLLGVTKRILDIFFFKVKSSFKLDVRVRREMIVKFEEMQKFIPREFEWKPEKLNKYSQYKAKELRYIVLYVGYVLFKEFLPVEHWQGLFNLLLAIRILSSPELVEQERWLKTADDLLYNFLVYVRVHLGPEQLNRNFHGLLHLVKCCRRFGALDCFSSFPYESFLAKVGNLIVSHKDELQQIVNRCMETSFNSECLKHDVKIPNYLQGPHVNGPIVNSSRVSGQYSSIALLNCTITTSAPNNVILLKNGSIFKVLNISVSNGVAHFIGKRFLKHENYFLSPLPSSLLNIATASCLDESIVEEPVSNLYRKCVAYHDGFSVVVVPYIN